MSKNRRIRDTSASPRQGSSAGRRREVIGVVSLGAAIFMLIAVVSLQAGQLVMGPFGRQVASLFYGLAGVCGYFLIALAVVAAIRTLIEREPIMPIVIVIGAVIGIVSLAILAHLVAAGYRVAGHGPGGAIGEHFGEILRAVVSTAGTALLALVGLAVAAVVATPLRTRDVLHAVGGVVRIAAGAIAHAALAVALFWRDVFRAMLPDRERDIDDDDDDEIEVDDRDVLEVADDETGGEPVIIGRAVRRKRRSPAEAAAVATVESVPVDVDAADRAAALTDRVATELDLVAAAAALGAGEAPAATAASPRTKRTRFANGTPAPAVGDDAPGVLEPAPPLDPLEAAATPSVPTGPVIVEPRFKNADKAT